MKLRVLGSAAGGGFPQWNCNCANCAGLRAGTLRARARTQSSIAVRAASFGTPSAAAPAGAAAEAPGDWVLFNASPDILEQIRACGPLQPNRALRDTGIGAIVLIDAQIDHTTGLLMLRENRRPLPIWCTPQVREELVSVHPLFRLLDHYCGVAVHELGLDGPVRIPCAAGLRFEALPIASNAPPYSPHRDRPRRGDNIAVRIVDERSGRSAFYAPGLERIEDHVWDAMRASDVVLVDGTCWTDDELVALGVSGKRARAMGHLPQSGPGGMIEWLDRLPAATRRILIHINNTNPILDEDSAQRAELARHAIEVAYDGMEIDA
jgi:pyrroloquinoline quinone biosynthesis protein B